MTSERKEKPSKQKKAKKESSQLTKGEEELFCKDPKTLRKKISYLEEELIRKDNMIEKLQEENRILFRTAIKNSEGKIEGLKKEK